MLKLKPLITEDRLDEAPAGAVIANTLDRIRVEARRTQSPEVGEWLHPHLRKIENALRKLKRSGT